MPELLPITLDDMVKEVDQEISFRERAFPRRAQSAGLALRNQLQRRIDVMRAIKAHLEAERDRQ
jgi:hypothetical protein